MSATIKELVQSEIADFCAGLGNPGEPVTPEQIQLQLMNRILPLFEPASAELAAPAGVVVSDEWSNDQCMQFLSIAFRHAEIKGDIEMDDIRLAVKMVNAAVLEANKKAGE